MARFVPALDVWALDDMARARLQPGQWITAGPGGPVGRWAGLTRSGVAVAAWRDNARRAPGGPASYFRDLLAYARSNGRAEALEAAQARQDALEAAEALALEETAHAQEEAAQAALEAAHALAQVVRDHRHRAA